MRWRAAIAASALLALPGGPAPAAARPACTAARNLALQATTQAVYERIGQSRAFTGLGLFEECGPIDVFSTGTDAGLAAAALLAAPASDLRFHVVPNSLETLLGVQRRITADAQWLRAQGFVVDRYWPQMETGLERIEVVDATAAQVATLTARYGSDRVVVASVDEAEPATPFEDAANDTPPFDGGIFLANVNTHERGIGVCTAGFGVHTGVGPGAPHYLLTAGHCSVDDTNTAITGTAWHNAAFAEDGTLAGSLLPVGVVSRNFLPANVDGALIDVPLGTTSIWQGWYTSGRLAPQHAAARAQVGMSVCVNGAYDGTRCGAVVQSINYLGCKALPGHPWHFCRLIRAGRRDGTVVGGPGDSGGAIIGPGPRQSALGVASLGTPPFKACPHFTSRGDVCSSTIYFTDLPSIFEAAGGGMTVNTLTDP